MALELRGKLNLDGSGFFGVLKQADSAAQGFAEGLKHKVAGIVPGGILPGAANFAASLGHGIEERLTEITKEIIESARQLKIYNDQTGIAFEDLQVYEAAAKKTGKSLEDVVAVFNKMTVARANAIDAGPASEMARNFQRLGISFQGLKDKDPREIFRELQENFRGIADKASVADAMVSLFGKNAMSMMGFFIRDLEALKEHMRAMGHLADDVFLNLINAQKKFQSESALGWENLKASLAGGLLSLLSLLQFSYDGVFTGWKALFTGLDIVATDSLKSISISTKETLGIITHAEAGILREQLKAATDKAIADLKGQAVAFAKEWEALKKSFSGQKTAVEPGSQQPQAESQAQIAAQGRIDALADAIAKRRLANELAALSGQEKLNRLVQDEFNKTQEIGALRRHILEQGDKATLEDKEKLARAELQLEELRGHVFEALKQADKKDKDHFTPDREQVDSFRRIGLIQGGTLSGNAERHTDRVVTAIQQNKTAIAACEQQVKNMIATVQNLV